MTDIPTPAPEEPEGESAVIRELREKANRTAVAEAKAAELEREIAFDRAGVPTEGPASYFRKAYDGEVDSEAIRSAYEAGGFAPATPAEVPAQELADASSISSAMNGGAVPAPTDTNAQLREVGKDGYGDPAALDAAIAGLGLTSEDFDRIAMKPYG